MFGELQHFGDFLRRNALLDGAAPGISCGEERFTWRDNEARATLLANALLARGLAQGDRVGVLGNNCVAFAEAYFALPKAGLVAVPINNRLKADEVAFILNDSEARGLLVGDEYLAIARAAAAQVPSLAFIAGLGRGDGAIVGFDELLASSSEAEPELARPIVDDDLLLLLYTSGTTGFPKGVMHSQRRTLLGTLIHVLAIGSHRHHRVMLPSPLYSAAGFAGIACAVAVASPTFVIPFSVEKALETIERERITFTNLVPTTLAKLLDHPRAATADLSSLEILLYGGAPMPEPILRRASARLGCGFRQTFATSETGLSGTVFEPEDHRRALAGAPELLASCGKPQVGVGIRLLDDDWNEVEFGEIGEVAVKCDANMVGYWRRPGESAAILRDGWLRTGDLARRDAEGYFYLVDRKNDMIVSGALNVYPTEVERILLEHGAVADCAVAGVPDERWGEAVKAFVVARAGHSLEAAELIDFVKARLAGYKVPKSVDFVAEIPRNPTGKILRRSLRAPYWREQKRGVA